MENTLQVSSQLCSSISLALGTLLPTAGSVYQPASNAITVSTVLLSLTLAYGAFHRPSCVAPSQTFFHTIPYRHHHRWYDAMLERNTRPPFFFYWLLCTRTFHSSSVCISSGFFLLVDTVVFAVCIIVMNAADQRRRAGRLLAKIQKLFIRKVSRPTQNRGFAKSPFQTFVAAPPHPPHHGGMVW